MTDPFRKSLLERIERLRCARARGDHFWATIALGGAVGWMIALPMVGGVLLGRVLDRAWGTGVSMTLGLMMLGLFVGAWTVWRTLNRNRVD